MSEELEEEYEEEEEQETEQPKAKEKVMGGFEKCIKAYLEGYASRDQYFAKHYAKPKKNIFECCEYIMGQAKKRLQGGNCVGMTDDEVFHLAREYYELDKIKDNDKAKANEVIGTESTGMINDVSNDGLKKSKAYIREEKKLHNTANEDSKHTKQDKDGNKSEQLNLFDMLGE